MQFNSLKIALRNIGRNRVFSAINLAGLALGMAVFLLIAEYVASQWNYNRFNKNYSSLFKIISSTKDGNGDYIPPGLAPIVEQKFPAVKATVRVAEGIGNGVISFKTAGGSLQSFREPNIYYADGNFLEVFSMQVLAGNPSFQAPNNLALSEKMAMKLFGSVECIGKSVSISNQFGNSLYQVNAVYQNKAQESDINPEILLSIHTLDNAANRDGNDWADPTTLQSGFVNVYLLLKNGTNADQLAKQVTDYIHQAQPTMADDKIQLQPFKYLHLPPNFSYPFQTFGSLGTVLLLIAVAVLILIIAWVNYINLCTAQALKRSKETGVRKVMGASRWQLVLQFMGETMLFTVIGLMLSFMLLQLLQPLFNRFTEKDLSLTILNHGYFWPMVLLLILGAAILSGAYVAFVLSGFKPITAIRGKQIAGTRGISLRKSLVVFQFTISIVLIVSTIVLYKQLKFMQSGELGMNLNQLLVIKGPTVSSHDQAERNYAFKNELKQLAFVKKEAASNNVPGMGYNFSTAGITKQNPQQGDDKKNYSMFISDNHFFDTWGIQFAQGSAFSEEDANRGWNKAGKVILNEKAATQLGFERGSNIIGKKIVWEKEYEIVGVVKDYHHLSMRQAIEPVIYLPSVSFSYFTIQTGAENMAYKLSTIEKLYRQYFPGNPYEYFFAEETYNQQFNTEKKLGGIFIAASGIAIFIACLGLFGLAAFSAQQRIKEIGVRKVLGASVMDITTLLSADFLKLVVIAILLACPLAWWGTSKWLNDFAYRTPIGWWVFVAAGGMAIGIAIATISFQAIKAALNNPVKSLRSE